MAWTPCITHTLYEISTDTPSSSQFTYPWDMEINATDVVVQVLEPTSSAWRTIVETAEFVNFPSLQYMTFITTSYDPPDGTLVSISRSTDCAIRVDYQGGSTITEANLDGDKDQQWYLLQELLDVVGTFTTDGKVMRLDPSCSYWEGQTYEIRNIAAATLADSAVTLAQLEALLAGGEAINIGTISTFTWTVGSPPEDGYELVDWNNLAKSNVWISIDGISVQTGDYEVYQSDDSGYPVGFSFDVIVFDAPLVTGQKIEARIIAGSIVGSIASNTVGGSSIQDCAIALRHLCFPDSTYSFDVDNPTTSRRRLVFNKSTGVSSLIDDLEFYPDRANPVTTVYDDAEAWLASRRLSHHLNTVASPFVNQTLYVAADQPIVFVANNGVVSGLRLPIANQEAANKQYVDEEVGAALGNLGTPAFRQSYSDRLTLNGANAVLNHDWNIVTNFRPDALWITLTGASILGGNNLAPGYVYMNQENFFGMFHEPEHDFWNLVSTFNCYSGGATGGGLTPVWDGGTPATLLLSDTGFTFTVTALPSVIVASNVWGLNYLAVKR